VLFGLFRFYHVRVELQTAHELGEQLLHLAQQTGDPTSLLQAHMALALTSYSLGELTSARAHFEQGLALYDPQQQQAYPALFGHDPAVASHSFLAQVLWVLGYPDQALKESHKSLALAEELAQPFNLAWALCFAATVHQYRREAQAARERAEAAMALCIEHEFPQWLAMARMIQSWALAEQGQAEGEAAVLQIRQGLADWRATGAKLGLPAFLVLLVELHLGLGQAEEGLSVVAEGMEAAEAHREHWWEPELHRLRGELLLLQGDETEAFNCSARSPTAAAEAETCFQHAIEVARSQQAKSLELRAAMSLSRLWQQQGQREEAQQLLAEVYGWFTEGFDTPDLKEAKVLLEELS
jgi:predicted ATPase